MLGAIQFFVYCFYVIPHCNFIFMPLIDRSSDMNTEVSSHSQMLEMETNGLS